ncbi:MAG: ABC-type lipoprotein export system ATPase subunit [Candidatus Midichloriaceae bacterium]
MSFLSLKNISKYYKHDSVNQCILSDVNINLEEGVSVAIVGPSGSGKSTLLKIIGLLDDPSSGSVMIDGIDYANLSDSAKTAARRELIGFIFQSYNLISDFTVIENVIIAQEIMGVQKGIAIKNAMELFERLDIKGKENYFPQELSGGEQQRVAIARSLINKPKLLLADEPTGSLDINNTENILNVFQDIAKEFNVCNIVVTHDIEVAKKSDLIFCLNDGKLEAKKL